MYILMYIYILFSLLNLSLFYYFHLPDLLKLRKGILSPTYFVFFFNQFLPVFVIILAFRCFKVHEIYSQLRLYGLCPQGHSEVFLW